MLIYPNVVQLQLTGKKHAARKHHLAWGVVNHALLRSWRHVAPWMGLSQKRRYRQIQTRSGIASIKHASCASHVEFGPKIQAPHRIALGKGFNILRCRLYVKTRHSWYDLAATRKQRAPSFDTQISLRISKCLSI